MFSDTRNSVKNPQKCPLKQEMQILMSWIVGILNGICISLKRSSSHCRMYDPYRIT
jgi:hypothetical protein